MKNKINAFVVLTIVILILAILLAVYFKGSSIDKGGNYNIRQKEIPTGSPEDVFSSELDLIYNFQENKFEEFVKDGYYCDKLDGHCTGVNFAFLEGCANNQLEAEEKVRAIISSENELQEREIYKLDTIFFVNEDERFFNFEATNVVEYTAQFKIFKCYYFEPSITDPEDVRKYITMGDLNFDILGKLNENYRNNEELKNLIKIVYASERRGGFRLLYYKELDNKITLFFPAGAKYSCPAEGEINYKRYEERIFSIDEQGNFIQKQIYFYGLPFESTGGPCTE